jgi:hypothetical protein
VARDGLCRAIEFPDGVLDLLVTEDMSGGEVGRRGQFLGQARIL